MNETFKVSTAMDCSKITQSETLSRADPLMRINFLGCSIFELLLELYKLNVTYVDLYLPNGTRNHRADVFVVPRSLFLKSVDDLFPVSPIINSRQLIVVPVDISSIGVTLTPAGYGFILRRPETIVITHFYSVPFQRSVWNLLYVMCLLISVLFYVLKCWERKIIRRNMDTECSYAYELLVAIGAYCQRVPHINAKLWSRRITYLIFFTFGYLIHCYYTSNLLSRLVNDRDKDMALDDLAESNYEFAMLDNMVLDIDSVMAAKQNPNLENVLKRFIDVVKMNISTSLEAILSGRVAVFSDYVTIYPFMRRYLDDHTICNLIEVDMFTDVKKYFFTSKQFPYIEQFKVGTLRLKEAGLLRRLRSNVSFTRPTCSNPPHIVPCINLVAYPFVLLAGSYLTSFIVLGIENLHYKFTKNKMPRWPYIN